MPVMPVIKTTNFMSQAAEYALNVRWAILLVEAAKLETLVLLFFDEQKQLQANMIIKFLSQPNICMFT